MKKETRENRFLTSLPFWGIGIFLVLYVIAAFFYPGGSRADQGAKTFSWFNNYWCDLLSEPAKNGQSNTARPVAVVSWIILCFSLAIFWYHLPKLFSINSNWKKIIQISGVMAMLIAVFLFTSLHDIVIQAAGLASLAALTGALLGFYRTGLYGYFWTGLFCVLLMGLNYFIMISDSFSHYLPVIQKLTFVIVLMWVVIINRTLYLNAAQQRV